MTYADYESQARELAAAKWEEQKRRRSNSFRMRQGLEGLKKIPRELPADFLPFKTSIEYSETARPGDTVRAVIMGSEVVRRALIQHIEKLDNEKRVGRMSENVSALRSVDPKAADKLAVCHDVENYELAWCSHVDSCGHEEVTTLKTRRARCWLRVCPKCSKDIAQRLRVHYAAVIGQVVKPNAYKLKHLVLTMPRSDDLRADIERLHKAAKKLVKHFWTGRYKDAGAFATVEIGPRGGNVHAHVVVYGHYVSQDRISDYWRKLTGAPVVWIKAIDAARAVGEAVKYITKLSKRADGGIDFELSPDDLAALHMALKGKRRAWAWGSFYGLGACDDAARDDVAQDANECTQCHHVLHVAKVSELRGLLHLKNAINCSIAESLPAVSVPMLGGLSPGPGP